MAKSYVGIITRDGLQSFLPENDHVVRFLVRRAYRRQPLEALCYWAIVADSAAEGITRQLSYGEFGQALATLHACALRLGTVLPSDTDSIGLVAEADQAD